MDKGQFMAPVAQLEVFMHLGPEGQDIDYVRAEIEIPPKMTIDVIPPANLPSDWNASPAPWTTKNYGMQWIRSRTAAVLKVPAVFSPGEFNYILNPAHREFHKIKVVSIVPHRFDGRMWKDSPVKTK
jgi:RES domain-containing protein